MSLEKILALERKKLKEEYVRIKKAIRQEEDGYALAKAGSTPSDSEELASSAAVQSTRNETISGDPFGQSVDDLQFKNQSLNLKDFNLKAQNEKNSKLAKSNARRKYQDDMDQWVSDTFFSYFPGFNNEYQKRQNYLQQQQNENHEKLKKYQILNAESRTGAKLKLRSKKIPNSDSDLNIYYDRSIDSTCSRNGAKLQGAGKSELNLINQTDTTNNQIRPGSTRYKLLQDLRHTDLANVTTSIRNRHQQTELISARKKEYQLELLHQIEEKRRNIQLLKEKEQQQEEALTRRLQEQINTMKLEEQLEKEHIRAEKVRFEAEQNRLQRQYILTNIEKDSDLLQNPEDLINCGNEANKENFVSSNKNRVYQYFSNSAHHQYRYNKLSPSESINVEFEITHPGTSKIEQQCSHLVEKICPVCEGPLKTYENFCLRCQKNLSLHLNTISATVSNEKGDSNEDADQKYARLSYSLICEKCDRFYAFCPSCLNKSDVCRACRSQRNICMNCRRTLCSFCLEEVACGKDTEQTHINESEEEKTKIRNAVKPSEASILCFEENDNGNENECHILTSPNNMKNNLNMGEKRPSYSTNIKKNSIFHDNYNPVLSLTKRSNVDSQNSNEVNLNIDVLRRDVDKRLTRYVKNYGDLALKSRGTQTTTPDVRRDGRDVVLKSEQNLSIPLLREMPKMTRNEAGDLFQKNNSTQLENLNKRWEIPAVQKTSISSTSPNVLTQVGTIRKELQADLLFLDRCY